MSQGLRTSCAEGPGTRHVRGRAGPGGPGSPTVVLLHGIVSSRYLVPTGRHLARECKIAAPDLPGFGPSPATGPPLKIHEDGRSDRGPDYRPFRRRSRQRWPCVSRAIRARWAALFSSGLPSTSGPRSVAAHLGRWAANAPGEPRAFNALAAYEVAEMGPARMLRSFKHAVDRSKRPSPRSDFPSFWLEAVVATASLPRSGWRNSAPPAEVHGRWWRGLRTRWSTAGRLNWRGSSSMPPPVDRTELVRPQSRSGHPGRTPPPAVITGRPARCVGDDQRRVERARVTALEERLNLSRARSRYCCPRNPTKGSPG
jgi:pimeloyl-ACP methyl ester carboxylesterase